MLSVHRAPASYTGEDVVEISCHGGVLVTARVWETCLRAGARAARPGEFTERAFLSGKLDLTQAEAVIDLIRAQTDLALRSAAEQLEGRLGEKISKLREDLISLIANLEAYIDFPDEDIEPDVGAAFLARLDAIRREIEALLATADQGRIFREGVRVVIYGATNAGKSSLLNRLLGFPRAIVSETPGTTRDTIEEVVNHARDRAPPYGYGRAARAWNRRGGERRHRPNRALAGQRGSRPACDRRERGQTRALRLATARPL